MANVRTESKPRPEKARYAHGKIERTSSIKTVYVQDQDFWDAAKDHAEKVGLSLSEMIMQSLAEYMGKDKNHCGTCARVREILSAGSIKGKK